jgi:transcriptional regulator with XRE-family HTH domain
VTSHPYPDMYGRMRKWRSSGTIPAYRCKVPSNLRQKTTKSSPGTSATDGQIRSGATDRVAPKPRLLADLLGIAQPTLSAYESGHRQPTLPTLMRMLARAGLELRLDLAQTNNHDAMLAEWERTLEESDKDRLRSRGYRLVSDAA